MPIAIIFTFNYFFTPCLLDKGQFNQLYAKYPVRSIKDLKQMLFDDLRIDYEEFIKLDLEFIVSIAPLYCSNTLHTLVKYINKEVS